MQAVDDFTPDVRQVNSSRAGLSTRAAMRALHPDVDDTIEGLGFFYIPHAIRIPEMELVHIGRVRTMPIFNNAGMNDRKRRQAKLSESLIPIIMAQVRAIAAHLYPCLSVVDPVVLHSIAGCQAQKAHMDYIPKTLLSLRGTDVPRGALIALQEGTTLDVWPGSHLPTAHQVRRQTLLLDVGDVVFFRGDLVHAGSAYQEANLRLHMYLDNVLVPRVTNSTWILSTRGSAEERARIVDRGQENE